MGVRLKAFGALFALIILFVILLVIIFVEILKFLIATFLLIVFTVLNLILYFLDKIFIIVFGRENQRLGSVMGYIKQWAQWADKFRHPINKPSLG